jgi:hypothetical protein
MHKEIQDSNYLYIPKFISEDRALGLANSFVNYCISKQLPGDSQAENSHSAYNYIDFLELLCEKTPEVSKFLGETVLPTYSYARVYKEGSVLTPHQDRDACEVSLTLNLSSDVDWPIYIKKPNGEEVSLNLKSGDAMLYLGCDAEHWRSKFEGREYVQVFMHYVKSRGDRNYAFFDNKEKHSPKLLMSNEVKEPTKIENKSTYKKNIEDYIIVFDNILSNEVCDAILNEYVNSPEWYPTVVGEGTIERHIRNTDSIGISIPNVIQRNQNVRKALDDAIFNGAANAIQKYNDVFFEARIMEDSGYDLLRYHEGQFYIQHTDSFKTQPRSVSCSFALNDDYEGGEFAFWDREKKVILKKGSVIMFPSNFMYPHEIMPVTKGTRYSIVTWFI